MNKNNLLTFSQVEKVTELVILAFEAEIARIPNEVIQRRLLLRVMQWHNDRDFFTFFTAQAVRELAEEIFTQAENRSFILNIAERVSLRMTSSDLDYDDVFVKTYAKAIARNKAPFTESGKSLINKEVQQSIGTTEEVIETLLKDNFWLFVTYVMIMNLHISNVYAELTKLLTQTNGAKKG
jgi:hypothetical protein